VVWALFSIKHRRGPMAPDAPVRLLPSGSPA